MIPKRHRDAVFAAFAKSGGGYPVKVYGIVTPRKNGEFTLNCYAIKETKKRGVQMTEVNRAWSDRDEYLVKDIWKTYFGHTCVVFDEHEARPNGEGQWYEGRWGEPQKWTDGGAWFMPYIRYLNLDALKDTRYRYCQFDKYRGPMPLVRYAALYARHPQVEHIVKAGLCEFVTAHFLDRLAADKGMRDFFRSNAAAMAKSLVRYTPTDVIRAKANGWTVETAHKKESIRRHFNWAPPGIDREALHDYLEKHDIDKWDYIQYCRAVKEAKLDLDGYGVAFPRDFHKAVKAVHRRILRAKAKEDVKCEAALKEVAARVNALLARMKKRLAALVGEFEVVVPTTRRDFVAEGQAMRNCIGGYFDRCADGTMACFFIRKNGRRFADVEMGVKDGSIHQCRLSCNRPADDATRKFAEAVAKRILPAFKNGKVKAA